MPRQKWIGCTVIAENLCPSDKSWSRMIMVKHTTVATNMNGKFTEVTDGMVVSDEKTGQSHFM
jgi:hypothetical protein